MHLATAVKLVIGLRAVSLSTAALTTASVISLSTKTLPYLLGLGLGTFTITVSPLMLLLGALFFSVGSSSCQCDGSDQNSVSDEERANARSICYDQFVEHYQQCVLAGKNLQWGDCPEFKCALDDIIHAPDDLCFCADQSVSWVQIVYGQFYIPPSPDPDNPDNPQPSKDYLLRPQSCWVVAYSYDNDNNLLIPYNPGLNEDYLRSKALKPHEVSYSANVDYIDQTELFNFNNQELFDHSFWAAEYVDVECRKWQPGDLIPTK